MKIVAIAAVLAFSTVAGVANATANVPKTRAQVVAELHQAQAQGLISQNKLDYPVSLPATQHKTRQQVLAELASAQAAGQISTNRLDYPVSSHTASSKSRSEVVAELLAYQSAHPYANTVNNH